LGFNTSIPIGPNSFEYNWIRHKYGPTVLALTGSQDWTHKMVFNLFDKFSDITDEKGAQAALLQAQSDLEKAKDDVTIKVRDEFYNLHKSLIQIDSAIAKIRYQDKQNAILEYLLGLQETSVANVIESVIEQSQNKFSFIQAVSDYHLSVSGLSVAIGDPDYFESRES
jgi:outer membrane protein TolC